MSEAGDRGVRAHSGVSILILTLDEEMNIARCLDSVQWCDDVVVLDSFSGDRTLEIARAYTNVRTFQRPFDDYSSQRNYGLHEIRFVNPWVLVVDADEVVGHALASEIREVVSLSSVPFDVFLLRRKVFIDGCCVRRNISSDFWIARLLRPLAVRYEGAVHEKVCFVGGSGRLHGALEHHQFAKGIDQWFARRARYAAIEATSACATAPGWWTDLTCPDTLRRRAAVKRLFYRLPARWLIYLAYNVLYKLAFLDGARGLRYVYLETRSQFLAARQTRELKNARAPQAHTPLAP
jgi:glycosyltransferase involved in cell wall biosynthesis